MVRAYRAQRSYELHAHDWRDETAYALLINFKRWLIAYRYEQP